MTADGTFRLPPANAVEMHIERIVLHGVPEYDVDAFRRSFTAALRALVEGAQQGGGVPEGGHIAVLRAPDVAVPVATATELGAQVARSVWTCLPTGASVGEEER
jgi:hypothetical protein